MNNKTVKSFLISNIMLIGAILLGLYNIREYYTRMNTVFLIVLIIYIGVIGFIENNKVTKVKQKIFLISHQAAFLFVISNFMKYSGQNLKKALVIFVGGLILFNAVIYLIGIFCIKIKSSETM